MEKLWNLKLEETKKRIEEAIIEIDRQLSNNKKLFWWNQLAIVYSPNVSKNIVLENKERKWFGKKIVYMNPIWKNTITRFERENGVKIEVIIDC